MLAVALVPATTRADTHGGGKRHRGLRSPATRRHVRPVRHDRAHAAIVGGHFARSGQFPWVARIVARHGNLVDLCTGTVVAAKLILTAGHCAEEVQTGIPREPGDFEVQTAAYLTPRLSGRAARVSRVLVYPGFEPRSGIGDVA